MSKRYITYYTLTALLSGIVFWSMYSTTHVSLLTTSSAPITASTSTTPDGIHVNPTPPAPPTSIKTTLTIGESSYALEVPEDASVLDAMRTAEVAHGFSFTGREYAGLGFFVDSIEGKKAAGGYDWFLYVNGVSSDTGASQTTLRPGDRVEWRYEKDHY